MDINLKTILEQKSEKVGYEKYIFVQSKKKFIYSDPSENEIVGVNSLFNNKFVEIIDTIDKKEKVLGQIAIDSRVIGWTEVDINELIRIYRLPILSGIIELEDSQYEYTDKYGKEFTFLKNKIIRPHYVFLRNEEMYFIIGTLSGDKLIPIKAKSIKFLNKPKKDISIFLESGQKLYKHSNLIVSVGTIKQSKEYLVTRYFNDSTIIKVKTRHGEYWTSIDHDFENSRFSIFDEYSLDIMDYIVWLTRDRFLLSKSLHQTNKRFEFIRKNLVVDTEQDRLFLERYVGNKDDN